MADAKISSLGPITGLNAIDLVPIVQGGANKITTLGQLKTFVQTPTATSVVATTVPLLALVNISGACTLPAATVEGTRIVLFATASGTLSAVGILPSNGFTFVADNYAELIWAGNAWRVLVNNGMTIGLV